MPSNLANRTEAELDKGPAPRNESLGTDTALDWRSVDRELRRLSTDRSKLDAEEARWLREAEALQIWRPLGMVSALDYLERVMGYSPKAGRDRLRVARALGSLPVLSAALAEGAATYSAVRELTRVATSSTEAEWLHHTKGMNARQVEEVVSGRHPGDRPADPPDPDVRTRVVRFEVSAESFALLRQAHRALNDEQGRYLDDDELVTALSSAVLENGSAQVEGSGRARFQVAITVCERCQQGWQDGAGVRVAIGTDAVARALCDAQHIGSIDGDAPDRATQDVPPSVRRMVLHRDGGRCRVPGCRSSRGLEVHHRVHRADGGSHDPSNLLTLCSACHMAHHRGLLTISGTAAHLVVQRPGAESAANVGPQDRSDGRRSSAAEANAAAELRGSALELGEERRVDEIATDPGDEPARIGVQPAAETAAHAGRPDRNNVRSPSAAAPKARHERHLGTLGLDDVCRPGVAAAEASDELPLAEPSPLAVRRAHAETAAHVSPRACINPPLSTAARPNKLIAEKQRVRCKQALVDMGWKPGIANAASSAALDALGAMAPLERIVVEALRRCPRPSA